MDPQELVPLEAARPRHRPVRHSNHIAPRACLRVPIRIFRLLSLLIVLPTMFLLVPLYLRIRVYSGQMYPMSMTDMRLIDGRISPTWCQRQVVKSNATFNAFVMPGQPELAQELVPVSMTRQLELEDDMKEYWGFYLLKGSTVTVSACVRYPGASLIMIKGYKHLQDCAYIGDDSSEELDELLEANKLGLISNESLKQKIQELKKVDGKANHPETMKRHKAGVSFHDPSHVANVTSAEVPTMDVTDHDPKELREILERLHAIREAAKIEALKSYHPPSHLMSLPALHRHRDANVDKDERRWLSFKDIDGNNSDQNLNETDVSSVENYTDFSNQFKNDNTAKPRISQNDTKAANAKEVSTDKNDTNLSREINGNTMGIVRPTESSSSLNQKTEPEIRIEVNNISNAVNISQEEVTSSKHISMDAVTDEANSKEVYEDVLKRLQGLGDKGKRVLFKLHQAMDVEFKDTSPPNNQEIISSLTGSAEELDRLRQVLVEAIDEAQTGTQRRQKRHDAVIDARAKRELMLGQIELQKQFNEDDEARDFAAEEGLEPDGYAEHHETVNETTALDMSNSEFWSSFSSSEEALLECEGLILNLPLTPHSSCTAEASDTEALNAAKANALTYRVPANGYYFFVFNSENEVQVNNIRARFDLQKTRYDVARSALRECRNSSDRCDLPLDIFSSQKVVLEVPFRNNDSLWNEQFLITSECEPRTSVYMVCVIAVPLLILIFAFQ